MSGGGLAHHPPAVLAREQPAIDEHADELLDEERVPLGTVDEQFLQTRRNIGREQLAEQQPGVRGRKRLELENARPRALPPARPALVQLRPGGRDHEQRSFDPLDQPFEQLEHRLLGPVQVLDEQRDRPVSSECGQELDPGVLEAVTGDQGMKIARDVEPQRQGEQRPLAQALEDSLRWIGVEQPEVLLQHFRERPVGDPLPVGEAAARALEGLRVLLGEPAPELAHEPRLADSGIAHDRDQMRFRVVDCLPVARAKELQFRLSPDEGVPQAADTAWPHEGECADETPADDAARLSLWHRRLVAPRARTRLARRRPSARRPGSRLAPRPARAARRR